MTPKSLRILKFAVAAVLDSGPPPADWERTGIFGVDRKNSWTELKPSSAQTYAGTWKRFERWCSGRGSDPFVLLSAETYCQEMNLQLTPLRAAIEFIRANGPPPEQLAAFAIGPALANK